MSETIRVLLVTENRKATDRRVASSGAAVAELLGADALEIISLPGGVDVILDENAGPSGRPANPWATRLARELGWPGTYELRGPVIFGGADDDTPVNVPKVVLDTDKRLRAQADL